MPDTQALNNNQNPGLLEEVALEDMLNARERRAAIQKSFLDEFHRPLVCLTLNIPGPVKVLDRVPDAGASWTFWTRPVLPYSDSW